MADETKRVIDQTTDSSLSAGDFIIVDSQSEGTRKFDLGTELTDIKQDLSYSYKAVTLDSSRIIQGGTDYSGNVTTKTDQIRTSGFIHALRGLTVHMKVGTYCKNVVCCRYNTSGQWQQDYGWYSGDAEITIDTESYLVFLFRTASNTNITPSQYDAVVTFEVNGITELNKLESDFDSLKDDLLLNKDVLDHSNLSTASQRANSGIVYNIDKETGLVTAKGTAVYDAWIHLYPIGNIDIDSSAVYNLCGSPSGSASNKYYLYAENSASTAIATDYGNGAIINSSSFRICFIVKSGQTVDLTFKPRLIKYNPMGFNTENAQSIVINSDISKQYWNNDTEVNNTYFSLSNLGGVTYSSANGYRTNVLGWFPAGTYHYKKLSGAFTIIANANTGEMVTLQGGFGKSQYIHDGNFTVAYPFYMFATSNDDAQPYVSNNSEFPSSYVYGLWNEKGKVININADGSGDYTTLKAGLEEAIKYKDCVVNVGAGTYDLTSEFSSEIASMDSSSSELSGLQIGNGMTINFSSKALVTFNYTGNNTYVKSRFSPFNMVPGTKGFTLNNLNLECSNCRYAIHDESNANANPYHNKYIDCKITKDNSANASWVNPLVIGGGLGQNGHIDIERCYFKSETISSIASGKQVNYHNASPAGSKSKLFVEGCYFDGIYSVGMSYYGSSTEMTTMQINGCSCPAEPSINQEGSASIVNVELRKFNNTIR